MKKIIIIISILFISFNLNCKKLTSIYADHKSFEVGDIITVIIEEKSTASSSAKAKTDKSSNHNIGTQLGQGPLGFIPLSSAGASSKNSASGDASTSRSGVLETKITAKITQIDNSDNLFIYGIKQVKINGEIEKTEIKGCVRAQDIGSNNTVYSYNIANAEISYTGKGQINDGAKVGFLSRILNFIF